MAENIDIDNLRNALEEFTRRLQDSSSAISDEERERRKHDKALEDAEKAIKEHQENQAKRIQKVTKELESLGRGLTNSGASFTVLNQGIDLTVKAIGGLVTKIPVVGAVVGGALKALGESAGEVAKLMVDQFQQAWNAYKDLQDTGVVTSFENLRDLSRDTGLRYEDINKALSKHTKSVAGFGGSMIVGMKAFGEVSRELTDVRKQFGAMGISSAEFTEFQAKYMAQEQSYGRIRGREAASLAQGTREYIENLDALSKLTGASRKDLENQRESARNEIKFRAVLEKLGPKTRESLENLNVYMANKAGPNIAKGIRDAASGAITSPEAQQLMYATNGKATAILDQLKKGLITEAEAAEQFHDAMQGYATTVGEHAQFTENAYTKNSIEAINFIRGGAKNFKDEFGKIKEAQQRNITGQNKQTATLSNTEKQLESASRNLQDFATSSELLPKVMDAFSAGLDGLTEQLAKMSGKSIPDDVKARLDERKATEATAKAQRDYTKSLQESEDAIDDQIKSIEKQIRSSSSPQQRNELERRLERLLASRREIEEAKAKPAGETATGTLDRRSESARQQLLEAQRQEEEAKKRREKVTPPRGAGAPLIPQTGTRAGAPQAAPGLGDLSAQFESGKQGSSAVGFDRTGGTSFGKYQIATRTGTMDKFMEHLKKTNPEIFERLSKAGPADTGTTGKFAQEWKKLAEEGKIQQSERDFIKSTHYDVGVKGTGQNIQKMIEQSKALQEVMFSTSVQHGGAGASDIFNKMFKDGMSEKDFIDAIYKERTTKFGSSTPSVQKSVMDRLAKERELAQGLIGKPAQQQAAAPTQPQQQAAAPVRPQATAAPVAQQQAAAPVAAINQAGFDRARANEDRRVERLQAQARGETPPTPQGRTGGIFRGPSTGYQVELHGTERVEPVDNASVTKEPLNTSVFGDGNEKMDKMLSVFETMIAKYDVMIDLLDNNNSQNRRLVQAMV